MDEKMNKIEAHDEKSAETKAKESTSKTTLSQEKGNEEREEMNEKMDVLKEQMARGDEQSNKDAESIAELKMKDDAAKEQAHKKFAEMQSKKGEGAVKAEAVLTAKCKEAETKAGAFGEKEQKHASESTLKKELNAKQAAKELEDKAET